MINEIKLARISDKFITISVTENTYTSLFCFSRRRMKYRMLTTDGLRNNCRWKLDHDEEVVKYRYNGSWCNFFTRLQDSKRLYRLIVDAEFNEQVERELSGG